jgi:shikimate kinase
MRNRGRRGAKGRAIGTLRQPEPASAAEPQRDVLTPPRTIVLVGLMGAGKSCIGRRLAARLGLPFIDADREIEEAAGCPIAEIFARHGEAVFRDGERRVIARLLEDNPVHVLATGGGAFMDPRTRALIRERAISVWLRAGLDLLHRRVSRRNDRPLLQVDSPRQRLAELIEQRYPVYAEADLTVESADGPPEVTLERVLGALESYLRGEGERERRGQAAPAAEGQRERALS